MGAIVECLSCELKVVDFQCNKGLDLGLVEQNLKGLNCSLNMCGFDFGGCDGI